MVLLSLQRLCCLVIIAKPKVPVILASHKTHSMPAVAHYKSYYFRIVTAPNRHHRGGGHGTDSHRDYTQTATTTAVVTTTVTVFVTAVAIAAAAAHGM
jgi:hypothetical protein